MSRRRAVVANAGLPVRVVAGPFTGAEGCVDFVDVKGERALVRTSGKRSGGLTWIDVERLATVDGAGLRLPTTKEALLSGALARVRERRRGSDRSAQRRLTMAQVRIEYDDDMITVIERLNRALELHGVAFEDDGQAHDGYIVLTVMFERFVLVSEAGGVYLGNALGLGFWSKMDPVGQTHAVVFETEGDASMHVAAWIKTVAGVGVRRVQVADPTQGASIEECVAAGLPRWKP